MLIKFKKRIDIHLIVQIVLFCFLIFLDRITKYLAVVNLKEKSAVVPIIDGVLEFQYLENSGAAFGIFQNMQWMFYIITAIILILVAILFVRIIKNLKTYCDLIEKDIDSFHFNTYKGGIFLNYLIVLLAAGAIGNLIDRLTTKYVVDFIYFKLINFPIFNVADIYVTVTAFLLIIYFIFIHKEDPNFSILSFSSKKKENNEQ